MTITKILADQIGSLVIANAEQAALIEQLRAELQKFKTQQTENPPEKVLLDESGFGGGYG